MRKSRQKSQRKRRPLVRLYQHHRPISDIGPSGSAQMGDRPVMMVIDDSQMRWPLYATFTIQKVPDWRPMIWPFHQA
jgi:hypothetical protein